MAPREAEMSRGDIDTIAWNFLGSEFTGMVYADWPIDRRIDAYLLRQGMVDIANDGSLYTALLERIMANIGAALRSGVLSSWSWRGPRADYHPG